MKKKLVTLLLVSAMAIGTLAGCGDDSKKEAGKDDKKTEETGDDKKAEDGKATGEVKDVTLKVWAPENQIQSGTIDSMTKSFQEAHPEWNIEFTVETQGEDTAKDAILADVGTAADVYFFANDQLPALVDAGAVAKLGGTTADMVKTTMSEAVIDTVTIGEDIYAVPFTHNTFFMYYDKSLLDENDIKSLDSIMAKETGEGVYNFMFDSAGGWKLGAWFYGAGNTIYGEDGTDYAAGCDWNNETGLAVTNYIIDLMNNPKCAFADTAPAVDELAGEHKLGAWFDGAWNYDLYKGVLGDDLGVAVIPTYKLGDKDVQLKGFYGSKCIGVNPQSANPEVAVAFAAYLGSEEMQLQRYQETAQVPTNSALAENAEIKADEVAATIIKEAEIASVAQPMSSGFSNTFWANVGGFATEISTGDFNHDNAQEKLDTFVSTMVVEE